MNCALTTLPVTALARTTATIIITGLLIHVAASRAAAQINAFEVAPADLLAGQGFGDSACASGNLFAVGSRLDDTKGANAGAVHVFNTVTGLRLRKMFAPATEAGANDEFGASVAAAGTILAVGAPGEASGGSQRGAVYLFNLQTGAFLRTLRAPDGANGDHFGHALAMDGDLLVIGTPDRDENGVSNSGAIYIYNLRANVFTPATGPARNLTTTDAAMGFSVAIEGTMVITGAPGDMVGGVAKGSIYILDGETFQPLANVTPAEVLAGNRFGHSVAITHGQYYAGAPLFDNGKGRVYKARLILPMNISPFMYGWNAEEKWGWSLSAGAQFIAIGVPGFRADSNPGSPAIGGVVALGYHGGNVPYLYLADGVAGDQLGWSVAVAGSTVVGVAPGRDSRSNDGGSAVIFSPLSEQGDSTGIAGRGNGAPGALESVFNGFNELAMSPDGWIAMRAGLTGPGSLNGKNSGIWTNGNPTPFNTLVLVKRTGVTLTGTRTATSFGRPVSNENAMVGFEALTSGLNITTANDAVYAMYNGKTSTFTTPLVEGETTVGNGLLAGFQTPRMNWTGLTQMAAPYTNRLGGTVTTDKDSGIVLFDASGVKHTVKEGAETPVGGLNFGQFLPRVAFQWFDAQFAAFLQVTTTTDNMAVFSRDSVENMSMLARKGADAPDVTGAAFGKFLNFLGEANSAGVSAFRATITPPAGFTSQNEGIWSNRTGQIRPVLMKGRAYAELPAGVTIKSFVRYGFNADADILAWVLLQGPGITTANDGAIILSRRKTAEPGTLEYLLREGHPAPGCSRARVATIQLVDHEYQGVYTILATLVVEPGGATAQDNQVLLVGRTTDFTDSPPCMRKPIVALRKGMRFMRVGAQTVNSISLPGFITDASGSLDTGLAHVVRYSFPSAAASAVVLFGDGSGSVLKLHPGF
jgi:hypothetical protein